MGQQTRQPLNLPEILVLNCNLDTPRHEELWRVQTEMAEKADDTWIPFNVKIRFFKKGTIKIINDETELSDENEEYEDISYNLYGTVLFIQEPGNPIGNLVSHIQVSKF